MLQSPPASPRGWCDRRSDDVVTTSSASAPFRRRGRAPPATLALAAHPSGRTAGCSACATAPLHRPRQLQALFLPPVTRPFAIRPAPARATLPTPLLCGGCRDDQSPPASPPGRFPNAGDYQNCTSCPICKDRSRLPSDGERESPPARGPADRCPARSLLHPARL